MLRGGGNLRGGAGAGGFHQGRPSQEQHGGGNMLPQIQGGIGGQSNNISGGIANGYGSGVGGGIGSNNRGGVGGGAQQLHHVGTNNHHFNHNHVQHQHQQNSYGLEAMHSNSHNHGNYKQQQMQEDHHVGGFVNRGGVGGGGGVDAHQRGGVARNQKLHVGPLSKGPYR